MPRSRKKNEDVSIGEFDRINTPYLSVAERKAILGYYQRLQKQGLRISVGGALLHAALLGIRHASEGQQR